MSRPTSTEVIELGQYLDPDFDPSSLTVTQLLGVLGFHNVSYPTPYTKAKLVQVFNEHIKSRAKTLQKERLVRRNTDPSDDGITDGITGELLGKKPSATPRRSRRLSRAPTEEPPVQLEPPKRRRSSAEPSLGGPSRKSTAKKPAAPILIEESESEEEAEIDPAPVKRVEKKKRTDDPEAKARRISGPDSGWEDNNIFQMGSPSPAKPLKPRKSVHGRKSVSAPPDSPLAGVMMTPVSPPKAPKFEPEFAADLMEEFKKVSSSPFKATPQKGSRYRNADSPFKAAPKREKSSSEYEDYEASLKAQPDEDDGFFGDADVSGMDDSFSQFDRPVETADEVTDEEKEEEQEEDESVAISRRIARGDSSALVARPLPPQKAAPLPLPVRLILLTFTILSGFASYRWKAESAPLGFCEQGTNTNTAVQKWKDQLQAIESCNRENRTTLYLPSAESPENMVACPEEYIIDKHPLTCTPCPDHATCGLYSVKCDNGYLLRPHPAFFWTEPLADREHASLSTSSSPAAVGGVLLSYLDGLPGLGSIAFPPTCVEDPKRKRNIGVLGKAMETYLAQERGRKLCAGQFSSAPDNEGGEAKTWGIAVDELKNVMQQKTPTHLLPMFDDTFNEAVQQLIQWGGVIIGEDASGGKRYLARTIPDLTWTCALTVKSRETWAEWKASVIGFFILVSTFYYTRYRVVRRRADSRRVAELVQIALDALRHQELAHHTDPVTAPFAYLSSLQLRDLILQEEHSIPARQRIWEQVEHIVEGNANVRANMEEVQEGDELKVWRWIGSSRRPTRLSYEEREVQLETPSKTRV